MDNSLRYITTHKENSDIVAFTTVAFNRISGKRLCECVITTNYKTGALRITSWFTAEDECNKGYGKQVLKIGLKTALDQFGTPASIEYVWNGNNSYVLDWLNRHFGAANKCPIAIQKNQTDDDWESHIYVLDKKKFMQYFNF